MKKKLTAAFCLILCVLLGGGIGYILGNPECRYQVLNILPAQWGVEAIKPQLVADEETASALAEEYYRKNFDPDGKDPRLANQAYYIPQVQSWKVLLMPEGYVLAARESYSTLITPNSGYYSIDIRAEDGAVLGISFD
ncbi:MAG: hypothetical protein IJE08_03570 [Clostridia bacterium]|nr:hypothetical protein [Clostridia bacterium]